MMVYLTIITTMLVLTQIIRVTQNHLSLRREQKIIGDQLKWLKDNNITDTDINIQREVYKMLYKKLLKEQEYEHE